MNKNILASFSALLLLILSATVGCSDDTDLYVQSKDCIVKSATLGTLYRTLHTKDSQGKDSTYQVTVTGALYPLSIDHLKGRIFNVDSLPIGTDVSRVVFSAFNSTGTNVITSLNTGLDSAFISTDSTDFTRSRIISVRTSDGLRKRSYTVDIAVHQEEADDWNWKNLGRENLLATLEKPRALVLGDSIYVWGRYGSTTNIIKAATTNISVWTSENCSHNINPRDIQFFKGHFYALADSILLSSTDGKTWTENGSAQKFGALPAVGTKQLFALSDKTIFASTDGIAWTESEASATEQLAAKEYAGVRLASPIDSTFEDILLLANDGTSTKVWKKNIDLEDAYELPWNFYPQAADAYPCPNLDNAQAFAYDEKTLLTGTLPEGGIAPLYVSADNGRTWRGSPDYTLPESAGAENIAVAVDAKHFVYVVYTKSGNIWRGRINRLGWKNVETAFTRSTTNAE